MPCDDCSRAETCPPCVNEPEGSKGSSPDDRCARCGALRQDHVAWGQRHLFVPADAETAGEPECTCSSGSPENYEGPARDCPVHGEPEAPECSEVAAFGKHCHHGGDEACCACGAPVPPCDGCGHSPHRDEPCTAPECACAHPVPMPEAPRRPPVAIAYALEDGTPFEIALPGDATVRAEDGVLIVMHTQSPVKGLVQYRPWGDQ